MATGYICSVTCLWNFQSRVEVEAGHRDCVLHGSALPSGEVWAPPWFRDVEAQRN